jgi:DNA-binding PadR family transcriptional regulator
MSPVFGHGRLRLYLLKLLDEAPRHGYEVIRLLEDRFMGLYAPSAGTVYPRLARLEKEGLVTHSVEGGRKVYRLTDAGRAELEARLDELADLETELRSSLDAMAREIRDEVRGSAKTLREELRNAARDIRREQRRDNRKGQAKPFGDLLSGGRFAEAMRFAETLGAGRDWLNKMSGGWPGTGCEEAPPAEAERSATETEPDTSAADTAASASAGTAADTKATAQAGQAAQAPDTADESVSTSPPDQPTAYPPSSSASPAGQAAANGYGPAAAQPSPNLDLALLDFVEAVRGAARGSVPDAAGLAECRAALAEARHRILRTLGASGGGPDSA